MTTTNGMVVHGSDGAGHAVARADLSVRFTDEQIAIILDTCCGGASKQEAMALIEVAQARGLNPILGECYFVSRYDTQAKRNKWAVQASIDSLRIKAEQTGLYAGQDEPTYEYDRDGNVTLARVAVWRKDWTRPAVGVARWDEYVQTTREGAPTKFWKQMPHNQLAKCAEALALRKAFPAVLAKIYVAEEMQQADNVEAPAPRLVSAATSKALPPGDARVMQELCDRIDAAESGPTLNAIAKDAMQAHRAGRLAPSDIESIKTAVQLKRSIIGAPKPPKSEPRNEAPPDDPGDAYEANEAEAEAMHAQYDQ